MPRAVLTLAAGAAFAFPLPAFAAPVEPTPSAAPAAPATGAPAAAASPQATSDPCGGGNRLLATLNRPTIGYSACAVPRGSVLLEEGYQSTVTGGANGSVGSAYLQGFERAGVGERLEVDLVGPSYNRMRAGGSVTHGWSDLGAGFKVELPQRGRWTYGIDGLFTAATGSGGFGNGGPSETVNLDAAYALGPAVGVGTTLAVTSTAGFTAGGAPGRYGSFDPSVVVTAQIPNAYQFYAEFVAVTKIAPLAGGRTLADFGLQKLLGAYVEVDAEYGLDFTPVAGSRFTYVGVGTGVRVR